MGNTPIPINTSSICNTCGEIISSNCVSWAGGAIKGLCKGASLTDAVTAVNNNATGNDCCSGDFTFPNVSGYTGKWVDFSPTIPTSGSVPGQYSWTISKFGVNFSYIAGVGTGPENNPSYMWTPQGDLKLRGTLFFSINPLVRQGRIVPIPLLSLPIVNFPSGFNAAQTVFCSTSGDIGIDPDLSPYMVQYTRAFLTIDYPTGILYLNYTFSDATKTNMSEAIFMGGITFNLA